MAKLIEDQFGCETATLLNEMCGKRYTQFEDDSFFIDDEWLDAFIEDHIGGGLIDCD
jgi:hypothetical protein